jgi:hypothetical protein
MSANNGSIKVPRVSRCFHHSSCIVPSFHFYLFVVYLMMLLVRLYSVMVNNELDRMWKELTVV